MKRLFGESRGKNEEKEKQLRETLTEYQNKVDGTRDLLREATDKIREASRLSAANRQNMTVLQVGQGSGSQGRPGDAHARGAE